uniref:Uncharacterized protein n=1 Tax=Anguilla anguilla TaxID=7936 RepID=A0A0E9PY22_ANGAN
MVKADFAVFPREAFLFPCQFRHFLHSETEEFV